MLSNQILAAASSASYQAMALRQADASARADLAAARNRAGSDATVIAAPRYAIGPDGSRYVVGGTVSSSRTGPRPGSAYPPSPSSEIPSNAAENSDDLRVLLGEARTRPATLSDVFSNRLTLSPLEFAQAFGTEFQDGLQQSKLQTTDRGVRSQEQLHYRAAGGLVTATPKYGTREGPDGNYYAVSGEVRVHSSSLSTPYRAAREAADAAAAATAPGDASAQDFAVARSAMARSSEFWRQAFAPHATVNLLE